jgi:nucleoside-diphosphate-sugar epimerase
MMLRSGLGDKARKVPTIIAPDFAVRLNAKTDRIAQGQLFNLGQIRRFSSEKAKRVLGWTTRPVSETLLDTANSLLANGVV